MAQRGALASGGPSASRSERGTGLNTKWRAGAAAAAVAELALAAVLSAGAGGARGQAVERWKVVEVAQPANDADEAVLARPIALAVDKDRLYIADALDCAVKVFSTGGRFLGSFGRKGKGPGELNFPSGVCVAGDKVAVADKLNFRVQKFDREGRAGGGFKLAFAPDRIFALNDDRLLITGNPSGRRNGERLLHIFDKEGRAIWDGFEARSSSDPVLDVFQNMILVCPGDNGDFHVIHRTGERAISRFSGSGSLLGTIAVDERLPFKPLDMPSGRGATRLLGFCWAAAGDGGLLYLSAPEMVDGKDLGPGRTLSVIDGQGRLRAEVELTCAVHRFLVENGRVFAIDDEGGLRIFEVAR